MSEKPVIRTMLRASMVGIHLVVATFVGFGIGYFFDKLFDTSPWMTFIFFGVGLFTGFRDMFRMAKEGLRDETVEDTEEPSEINDKDSNK